MLRVQVVKVGKYFGTIDVHESSEEEQLGPTIADLIFTSEVVDKPEPHAVMTMQIGSVFSANGAKVLWENTEDVIWLGYQSLCATYQDALQAGLQVRVALPLVEDPAWTARVAPVCKRING